MEFDVVKVIKQSPKSTVSLIRKKDVNEDCYYVRKELQGNHSVYKLLQESEHPYLPQIFEVDLTDAKTTVIEEYVAGESVGKVDLTEKQIKNVMTELCTVLEYLHKRGIIHRDIKPSNILYGEDGHIRLIDFDASRMPKAEAEQDTRLLGTRGYAPPEQYGFAQTDARTDIYALGVTFKQLLGEKAQNRYYRKMIQKCTNLSPDMRYQSAQQVKKAIRWSDPSLCRGVVMIALLIVLVSVGMWGLFQTKPDTGLVKLDAPAHPHWDGETGYGLWENVPESGENGEPAYLYTVYRKDPDAPEDAPEIIYKSSMMGSGMVDEETGECRLNLTEWLQENGVYYFTVSAKGDGITYENSEYVQSDSFVYTGENAPFLPVAQNPHWKLIHVNGEVDYFAVWDNLDAYAEEDKFRVTIYDEDGNQAGREQWSKEYIEQIGEGGIYYYPDMIPEGTGNYRFVVDVLSSRPNEYSSLIWKEPIEESAYSPWITIENNSN